MLRASQSADPAAQAAAQGELDAALEELELAEAPINFPVNHCFAPAGTDVLSHQLDVLCEALPEHDLIADDLDNMYNKNTKKAIFASLRRRDPELIPVYGYYYAQPRRHPAQPRGRPG